MDPAPSDFASSPEDASSAEYREALPICPRCLAPLPAGATRCAHCGADATPSGVEPVVSGVSGRRSLPQQLLRWFILFIAGIAAIIVGTIFLLLLVPIVLVVLLLYLLRRLATVRDDER